MKKFIAMMMVIALTMAVFTANAENVTTEEIQAEEIQVEELLTEKNQANDVLDEEFYRNYLLAQERYRAEHPAWYVAAWNWVSQAATDTADFVVFWN